MILDGEPVKPTPLRPVGIPRRQDEAADAWRNRPGLRDKIKWPA